MKFLLHQKLGLLAYVKAPMLEKKLLDLQAAVHNNSELTQEVYRDVEQEILGLIKFYKKID